MSYLFAILLGAVQGLTEFLPVSSSGHLSVLQNVFGVSVEGHLFFDTLLHLATLVAICIVYRRDLADMIREVFAFVRDVRHPHPEDEEPKSARRLALMIVIATLPLFIALPLNNLVESLYYNTLFIGFAFLLTGGILLLSDRLRRGKKNENTMTIKDALLIGLSQIVATLPGVSRSGTTITAGMAVGLKRSFAVKFAFLMSIPAVIGANILSLVDAAQEGFETADMPQYLVGMLVAGVTGYFAIKLVKMLSDKGKFGRFAYYCFAAGLVTIVLSFINF
jgi:undecaprenyl-diphosphatase